MTPQGWLMFGALGAEEATKRRVKLPRGQRPLAPETDATDSATGAEPPSDPQTPRPFL
jgi:hypothetical protein